MMNVYYQIKVVIYYQDEKGNEKKATKILLTKATSIYDANEKGHSHMKTIIDDFGHSYDIHSVSTSKISEVID